MPQPKVESKQEDRLERMEQALDAIGCGMWFLFALGGIILACVVAAPDDRGTAMAITFGAVFLVWLVRRLLVRYR